MASLVVDGTMAGIALDAAPIIFSLRLAGSPNLPNFLVSAVRRCPVAPKVSPKAMGNRS
jgi:hypothetical protein